MWSPNRCFSSAKEASRDLHGNPGVKQPKMVLCLGMSAFKGSMTFLGIADLNLNLWLKPWLQPQAVYKLSCSVAPSFHFFSTFFVGPAKIGLPKKGSPFFSRVTEQLSKYLLLFTRTELLSGPLVRLLFAWLSVSQSFAQRVSPINSGKLTDSGVKRAHGDGSLLEDQLRLWAYSTFADSVCKRSSFFFRWLLAAIGQLGG